MHCSVPIYPKSLNSPSVTEKLEYDAGFNNLVCEKCGAIYFAKDLRNKNQKMIIMSEKVR